MHFLHFGNKPQQPDDHLAKVRFLINQPNNTMPEMYTHHKELSLDDMTLWSVDQCFCNTLKTRDITALNSLNYAQAMALC